MSGTLSCSVFLLQCFAVFGVMLLQCATFSVENLEKNRNCWLTNYWENIDVGKECTVDCVKGETRIKCFTPQCKVLKFDTTHHGYKIRVFCNELEEVIVYINGEDCMRYEERGYYPYPGCRTFCVNGITRTICQSKRCSRSNSDNKNCTTECDIADHDLPCNEHSCNPRTYDAKNKQSCTVTCEKDYEYITCSYLDCANKNWFHKGKFCMQYSESVEENFDFTAHLNPTRHIVEQYPCVIHVPPRRTNIIFQPENQSNTNDKFKNRTDDNE